MYSNDLVKVCKHNGWCDVTEIDFNNFVQAEKILFNQNFNNLNRLSNKKIKHFLNEKFIKNQKVSAQDLMNKLEPKQDNSNSQNSGGQ